MLGGLINLTENTPSVMTGCMVGGGGGGVGGGGGRRTTWKNSPSRISPTGKEKGPSTVIVEEREPGRGKNRKRGAGRK